MHISIMYPLARPTMRNGALYLTNHAFSLYTVPRIGVLDLLGQMASTGGVKAIRAEG